MRRPATLIIVGIVLLIASLAVTVANARDRDQWAHCQTYSTTYVHQYGPVNVTHWRHAFIRCLTRHAHPSRALPWRLNLIRACESGSRIHGRPIPGTYDYTAQNPVSTASGAYQYLDTTWNHYKGYTRAAYAPPPIQDARALHDYDTAGPYGLWRSSQACWA